MSVPRKHHYLPQFYLARWAMGGTVHRYVRPRGAHFSVHVKSVTPAAVGYEEGLYSLPSEDTPLEQQRLEMEFFQVIDARAATALCKLERGEHGTADDKIAFAQFILSLFHRTPGRLQWMSERLKEAIENDPEIDLTSGGFEAALKAQTGELLGSLVGSTTATQKIAEMRMFRIDVTASKRSLLTSDRPAMLSNTLIDRDSFILLPCGPRSIVVAAHDEEVAKAFSSQRPDALVRSVNDAVVRQAEGLVVASNRTATAFVEKRLMRSAASLAHALDENGMPRWKAPLDRR